jgi:V/A-type H+-transporting ATPase subunit B
MYSDLASIYERAGRVRGEEGSVTLLPVLTVPEDDITHPIADLTGYITEGQIVFSREMHRSGIYPPVDILKSLSRLMQKGIRLSEHKKMAKGIFSNYAKGCKLRQMESIVGREGMGKEDIKLLDFADNVEKMFIHQKAKRTLEETLEIGAKILKEAGLY